MTACQRFLHLMMCMAMLGLAHPTAFAQSPPEPQARTMKIRLLLNGKTLPATLYDNPSACDFYTMLPLRLMLEDYAATEKIAYPSRKLNTDAAPKGFTPAAGDITYYAPWGNLALFHRGFRYSAGLVSLGRIESGVELLKVPGKMAVVIERAE